MSATLTLNCYIFNHHRYLLCQTDTLDDLKNAIELEESYRVSQRRCKHAPPLEYANIASILVHRDFKESTGHLKFDSNEALLPVEDLWAAFTDFSS